VSTTTTERDELRSTVRAFLARYCTEVDVRRLMNSTDGYDVEVWRQITTKLGLSGLSISEKHGGAGYSWLELGVVFEEMGAVLLPAPFFASVALAAPVLQRAGDELACSRYLPGIANGATIATVAISEEDGGWDEDAIRMPAEYTDGRWRLSGTKRFVLDAQIADLLLVAAHSEKGTSLFAVDAATPGVRITIEPTLDQTRKLCRVDFSEASADLVGKDGNAWPGLRAALREGATALALEQVGAAQHVLEFTTQYAKARIQFGRPIGSFQVIKHKLVDMLVEVEGAKSAAYDALRALAENDADFETAASVAKAVCSEAYYRIAAQSIQIHGGIGFTWEHPAHLYFKRARSSSSFLGSPGYHRDLVGRSLGI
jgi:alkylation response protein AidB-like acyl-CoA dehydrogenase